MAESKKNQDKSLGLIRKKEIQEGYVLVIG